MPIKGKSNSRLLRTWKIEIENGQLLIETVKHVMEEDLVDILECEIDDKVRKVNMMDKKELLNLSNILCTVDDLIERMKLTLRRPLRLQQRSYRVTGTKGKN